MAPPKMANRMTPPTFMTQRKYLQLISMAKKLDACKSELLRYRRGEKTAAVAATPGAVDGHTGLPLAGQNNPTNMERRPPKGERDAARGKRNSLKSVASEPIIRTTKRSVTPQMGRKKRHSDPTPLAKSFAIEETPGAQKMKDEGGLPRRQLAKAATVGEYKAKKKKKKKLQNTTQVFPHPKGTQKSRKKKKSFSTLPKMEISKRENDEYTFRSPHSADDQTVPAQVEAKLNLMPPVHTSRVREDPPDMPSMLSKLTEKKKSIHLPTHGAKKPLSKQSKSAKTLGEEGHPGNATNKRENESATKKGAPLSKGGDISRRKLRSVSRCTAQSAKGTRPQVSPSRGSLRKGVSPKAVLLTVLLTALLTAHRADLRGLFHLVLLSELPPCGVPSGRDKTSALTIIKKERSKGPTGKP
ncbi:hypothetical protein PVMG_02504 [Plasmodium vivax Mauritania I]|uniref:Uncharacterized protein n=1 Tax=Plasmodium vivax Mauritania I TaxID=1035515 RepID=A0A0J9W286_PLAVI|nr:hypothetical protein PVMG_02504 [Plasmodium vivax Mauritania I]